MAKIYDHQGLEDAYNQVEEKDFGLVKAALAKATLIGLARTAVCTHTNFKVKTAEDTASMLIALGPVGRRFIADNTENDKLRTFLGEHEFPGAPNAAPQAPPAAQPVAQGPLPPPVVPAVADENAEAPVAVGAAPAVRAAAPAGAAPGLPPLSLRPVVPAAAHAHEDGSRASAPRRSPSVICVDDTEKNQTDLGAALVRLMAKMLEEDKAKTTPGAAATVPKLDDALIMRVLAAANPLSDDERQAAVTKGVPKVTVDAYGQVSDLVKVIEGARAANSDTLDRLGGMLMRTLMEMGRDEAVGLMRHQATDAARYARAVTTAQGVYEEVCGRPRNMPEHMAGVFAWPAGPTSTLPTMDYGVGWAQWGLSAVMAVSTHPEAGTLRATIRHLLLPSWEAALATAHRWPQAPVTRSRDRTTESSAPPAKRLAGHRCATPGCTTQPARTNYRLCDRCFGAPPGRQTRPKSKPVGVSPATTPAAAPAPATVAARATTTQ